MRKDKKKPEEMNAQSRPKLRYDWDNTYTPKPLLERAADKIHKLIGV